VIRFAPLLLLCSCITFDGAFPPNAPSGATGTTSVTTAEPTKMAGLSCADASACDVGEVCVAGLCLDTGCDETHPCNKSCCQAGKCVLDCASGVNCVGGLCPASCSGAGCASGCCGADGSCKPGKADDACGVAPDACHACPAGAACSNGQCSCGTCPDGEICTDSGCTSCGSSPCSGATPVCDGSSTHTCRPCTADPSVCGGGTPYCNNDGACADTPTSDAACARFDSRRPVLTSSGDCGCQIDPQCSTGKCECHTATCIGRICADMRCAPCTMSSNGTSCDGTITSGQPLGCNGSNACGAGGCLSAGGQTCTADANCASNSCRCTDASCAGGRRCAADPVCGVCKTVDTVGACVGTLSNETDDALGCSGANSCDGSGACKLALGSTGCNTGIDCTKGFCSCADGGCTINVCSSQTCNFCKVGTNCTGNRNDRTVCDIGMKCRAGTCEGFNPGTCATNCVHNGGIPGTCSSSPMHCRPGYTESGGGCGPPASMCPETACTCSD
jgi:hypothetical protein